MGRSGPQNQCLGLSPLARLDMILLVCFLHIKVLVFWVLVAFDQICRDGCLTLMEGRLHRKTSALGFIVIKIMFAFLRRTTGASSDCNS
jgi:hypothetical protein